eukprot:gene5682-9503_t
MNVFIFIIYSAFALWRTHFRYVFGLLDRLITGLHLWNQAYMLVFCDIARERFVWCGLTLPMLLNIFHTNVF